jgi:hypothetical protein
LSLFASDLKNAIFLAPSEILPEVNLIRLSKFSKLAATSMLAGAKS